MVTCKYCTVCTPFGSLHFGVLRKPPGHPGMARDDCGMNEWVNVTTAHTAHVDTLSSAKPHSKYLHRTDWNVEERQQLLCRGKGWSSRSLEVTGRILKGHREGSSGESLWAWDGALDTRAGGSWVPQWDLLGGQGPRIVHTECLFRAQKTWNSMP